MSDTRPVHSINLLEELNPDALARLERRFPDSIMAFKADVQGVLDRPVAVAAAMAVETLDTSAAESERLLDLILERLGKADRDDSISTVATAVAAAITSLSAVVAASKPGYTVAAAVATLVAALWTLSSKQRRKGQLGGDLATTAQNLMQTVISANAASRQLRVLIDPADPVDYSERAKPFISKSDELALLVFQARMNVDSKL